MGFAEIWRPWIGEGSAKKTPNGGDHTLFSIVTTEPNGVVQPIHEQTEEVDAWLKGNSVEDALAMQKPAPDGALGVGPPVKPEKKAA